MEITNVDIILKNEGSNIKANANVTFDDELTIPDFTVMYSPKNETLFVNMPQKKLDNGKYINTSYTTRPEVKNRFAETILKKYDLALMEEKLAKSWDNAVTEHSQTGGLTMV